MPSTSVPTYRVIAQSDPIAQRLHLQRLPLQYHIESLTVFGVISPANLRYELSEAARHEG